MEPITAAPAGRGRFDASVNGQYIYTTRQPFLDAARVLAAQGVDPATPIGLVHVGSGQISIRSTVGVAAGLVVEEGDRLALRKYRPPTAVQAPPAADADDDASQAHRIEEGAK